MFRPGQNAGPPVKSYAALLPAGHDTGWHSHPRAQLVLTEAGILRCETVDGTWVVPPTLAVWIPAGRHHRLTTHGAVPIRALYLKPHLWREPASCCVLAVSPLLRALVLRAGEGGRFRAAAERRLAVLLDELQGAGAADLHLPQGNDRRLRRVTDGLLADPSDDRDLAAWGRLAGASERTLARLFRAETGLTFAAWRQRARFLTALALLAEGRKVTAIALDLGYAGPSAFIQAFKRSFGTTPGRWLGLRGSAAGALSRRP